MIRASAGVWLNYATTFAFQVVFASRYGTTDPATAFLITFAFAITLAGIFSSTALSVIVPRLVAPNGAIVTSAMINGAVLFGAGVLVAMTVFAATAPVSSWLAQLVDVPAELMASSIRASIGFVMVQLLAGQLTAFLIAQGRRFVPAAAPAIPAITTVVFLLTSGHASTTDLYAALIAGTGIQAFVLLAFVRRPLLFVTVRGSRVVGLTVGTLASYTAGAAVLPIERVASGIHDPAGSALYFYASRSLAVVQQLLVGGIVLAALGDWSQVILSSTRRTVALLLANRLALAWTLLGLAASIGLVAAPQLVELVYEHGRFTSRDTVEVSRIVRIALPGLVAEGLSLVVSQALLAAKENRLAILIGYGSSALRVVLVIGLGVVAGPEGVAIAYSVSTFCILVVQCIFAAKRSLLLTADLLARRVEFLLVLIPAAAAVVCLALRLNTWLSFMFVIAAIAVVVVPIRSRLGVPRAGRVRRL